jgi:hypothetical protein
MQRHALCFPRLVALALAAPAALAQFDATYTAYGTGCPGTGSGLGGHNVVPAPYANAFAGSDNSIPFTWSPVRYQQVFAGTDLPRAFTIGGLAVRQNERAPVAHNVTVDLEIKVAYTTRTPSTMNTTFAANFDAGAPVIVLPRTNVTFPDQSPTPPTSPAQFLMTIPWPTQFAWVPTAGTNLLIDVTVFGNSYGNRTWGYPLDAGSGQTARLWGTPANATTGALETGYGLVLSLVEWTTTAVPTLTSAETPQIGNQFPVTLGQARPNAPALLLFGASNQSWSGLSLPFDLGALGATGCQTLASGELILPVTTRSTGSATITFDIPSNIYILGGRFYNQFAVVDAAANRLGLALSNAAVGVFGNQ